MYMPPRSEERRRTIRIGAANVAGSRAYETARFTGIPLLCHVYEHVTPF